MSRVLLLCHSGDGPSAPLTGIRADLRRVPQTVLAEVLQKVGHSMCRLRADA